MDQGSERPRLTRSEAKSLIAQLKRAARASSNTPAGSPHFATQTPTTLDEKLSEERIRTQRLANDSFEKDQHHKERTLRNLFRFLIAETVIIFILAFLQGFGRFWHVRFHLDEWSFRLVIAATIGQITAMLTIAVQHLFPKNPKRG